MAIFTINDIKAKIKTDLGFFDSLWEYLKNTKSKDIVIWYHNLFMALKTFDKLEIVRHEAVQAADFLFVDMNNITIGKFVEDTRYFAIHDRSITDDKVKVDWYNFSKHQPNTRNL